MISKENYVLQVRGIGANELGGEPSVVSDIPPLLGLGVFTKLKLHILRSLSPHNERALRSGIGFWPLRFKDARLERKYCTEASSLARMRSLIASTFGIVVSVSLWLGGYFQRVKSYESWSLPMNQNQNLIQLTKNAESTFLFCRIAEVVGYLLIMIIPFITKLSTLTREKLQYLLLLFIMFASAIGLCVTLTLQNQLLQEGDAIVSQIKFPSLRDWTWLVWSLTQWYCLLQWASILTPLLLLDCVLLSRTYWTWIIHGSFFGCVLLTNLVERDIAEGFGWQQNPLCITTVIACCSVGGLLFINRCVQELKERVEFFLWVTQQTRLRVVRDELANRPKTKAEGAGLESVLEELIGMLRQAELLLKLSLKDPPPEVIDSYTLISKVLRTLLNSGTDLFQIRFVDISKEEATIIDQYVRGTGSDGRGGGANTESTPETDSPERQRKRRDTKQVMRNHQQMDLSPQTSNRLPHWSPSRISGVEDPSHSAPDLVEVLQEIQGSSKVGVEWNFNILELQETSRVRVLVHVGASLLLPSAALLDVPESRIIQFLHSMEKCYWANPYHNRAHAAEVAHTASCLLKMSRLPTGTAYKPLAHVALIAAALGHDVGHPSRNNNFFINTFDPLAIIYNDISVLENYHAYLTFQILHDDGSDIFQQILLDEYKDIRKRIIEMILATDMKQHFESISKFRIRRCAEDFDMLGNVDDMWHTIRMIMKGADLSHACVYWKQHFEWSCRIQEEFYQQGEEEALLGMPKSPLCDRATHVSFSKSQQGFLEFVVLPLFLELEEADPEGEIHATCTKQLLANGETWAELDADGVYVQFPAHVQVIRTVPQPKEL